MAGRGMQLAALAALAGACGCLRAATAPPPAAGSSVLSGGAPAAGFAQAQERRTFVFPRDYGPHREFREEWWYLTGNLDGPNGERFGFELTFFRLALAPPAAMPTTAGAAATGAAAADTAAADAPAADATAAMPAAQASAWRSSELYLAHFAVSDVARGRFRFAQKLSREALGLAGAQAQPLRVWIDDWSLADSDPAPQWAVRATQDGYAIELTLEPLTSPVLNGDAGLSRKSAEAWAASYYYSIPRLAVRGRLLRDGRPLEVHGLAWLDREWGSGGLGAAQAGWDWFALQLNDGSSLMFYALRERDGGRDPHSAGTWISSTGEARRLASDDVSIAVGRQWRDDQGVRYPAAWRLSVPALALEVAVQPVLADQELKTTPSYWEGAVDVSGARAGRRISGRGYVELVGYAPDR
jgi:predicted secreted hydrolase